MNSIMLEGVATSVEDYGQYWITASGAAYDKRAYPPIKREVLDCQNIVEGLSYCLGNAVELICKRHGDTEALEQAIGLIRREINLSKKYGVKNDLYI